MSTHLALLRAINLGAHQRVAMADLRRFFVELGFEEPRSLLHTGNLAFRGGRRTTDGLERLLEAESAKRLGLATDFFVRTAEEWSTIIARNPFPGEAVRDPGHLVLMCLKAEPGSDQVQALQSAIVGREVARVVGRQAYIVYPDGMGKSRLSVALIERKLGTRGTGRNWNTVLRARALCERCGS